MLFKVLNANLKPYHGGTGIWHYPDWMPRINNPIMCKRGYHLCDNESLIEWLGPTIWEAEIDPEAETYREDMWTYPVATKIVTSGPVRLVRRLTGWNESGIYGFAGQLISGLGNLAQEFEELLVADLCLTCSALLAGDIGDYPEVAVSHRTPNGTILHLREKYPPVISAQMESLLDKTRRIHWSYVSVSDSKDESIQDYSLRSFRESVVATLLCLNLPFTDQHEAIGQRVIQSAIRAESWAMAYKEVKDTNSTNLDHFHDFHQRVERRERFREAARTKVFNQLLRYIDG